MERETLDPTDEATTSEPEPADADVYGKIIEVAADDGVDGDLNGAPELAGLEESRDWTGVDALDGMRGRDAQELNRSDDAPLVEKMAVLERLRGELVERLAALGRELPERVIASEAETVPEDGAEALTDAAAIADELTDKIRRIDEAVRRIASEVDGEPA
jgi:hypothetical protein